MKWDVYSVFVCDYVLRSTWSAARMTGFVSLRIGWENWNESLTRWTGLTSGADNESTIASQGWRDAIDIQAQRNSDSALKTGCSLCHAVNERFNFKNLWPSSSSSLSKRSTFVFLFKKKKKRRKRKTNVRAMWPSCSIRSAWFATIIKLAPLPSTPVTVDTRTSCGRKAEKSSSRSNFSFLKSKHKIGSFFFL